MAAADRGRILLKLADLVEKNAEDLARLETLDTGHPLRDSRKLDVPRTAACYRYFGGMADKFQGETIPVEAGFLNYTLREPVVVVGQVVPWNFQLMFTSWKMAPALAAGNTIVMKPSEITPLTSLCIAGSRLVLHERIADEFLDRFVALARSIRLGNPLDEATEMGPLTSAQHRDRVLAYVDVAREQ